jgi:hypothetical protein
MAKRETQILGILFFQTDDSRKVKSLGKGDRCSRDRNGGRGLTVIKSIENGRNGKSVSMNYPCMKRIYFDWKTEEMLSFS